MGFLDFIINHFSHAAPILLTGIFAIAIIVERARTLLMVYPLDNTKAFFARVRDLVVTGRTGDAVALCDQYSHSKPLARIVKSGLLRGHLPDALVEHALEISVRDETQAITKRTGFLSMIANVATLLGLFGTILGLISSFEAVGAADPQQKSALLAQGISTAMNATMLGLAVAIPCMIAFSFLMNKANRLVADLENGAIKTLDILKQRYYVSDLEESSKDEKAQHLKAV